MEFHLVETMDEVIKIALEGAPPPARDRAGAEDAEGGTVAH